MGDEWRVACLGESGVTLIDCDHRTPPAALTGYPYVAIPQLKAGRIDLSDVRRISVEHFVEWTRKASPQAFDVVLSRRCNPGETAFVAPDLKFALGQNLVLLRSNGIQILPEFLRWIVRGPQWWEQVRKFLNVGAVFDSLRCADVPKFELPVPPLSEQRGIARILGALDDKIELNRKMNSTLEAMARALFKSWFVDFEPVRAKAEGRVPSGIDAETAKLFPTEFVESELGPIPKSWRVARLDELASIVMGLSPPGDSYNSDGIGTPLINGPVEFGEYFALKAKWTTEASRLSEVDDLIFCVRGSTTGRRVVADDRYALGRGVCAIRPDHVPASFLYGLVEEELPRLLAKTTGSVFPSLSAPDIRALSVVRPDGTIVEAFDKCAGHLLRKCQQNHREIHALAQLRDELLPPLLSGELSGAAAERTGEEFA